MLHLHRSERADLLVEALGDVLAEPLDDPMVSDVVAVPTRGVERWLTQRLSHRLGVGAHGTDGVCANIDFPFPAAMVNRATGAAGRLDSAGDPWAPERSVWPLLELVDAHLDEPFLAPLAAHLRAVSPAGGNGAVRRLATVRHLADLYDHYGVHRPSLVRSWAAAVVEAPPDGPAGTEGASGGEDSAGAGEGDWQAELWRRLRRRIGVASPAERVEAASARLAEDPGLLDLPDRISVFGLTRLPASHLAVLEAIAAGRDVHLFLLHPSAELWEKVAQRLAHPEEGIRRVDDPTVGLAANPLLRSWGRDGREMQIVLAAHGVSGGHHYPVAEGPPTLLARIQAQIRADRPAPLPGRPGSPDPRPPLDPADDSLAIHSCHGRSRQVEVLRDAVLHLLESDPTLEPRDVIVMCPDIEAFAPLVQAYFGAAGDGLDIPALRLRLADRSLRQTNPLLGLAAHLLDLAGSRLTASQVLDLASNEAVRRRFRLSDDDLSRIQRWVLDMGVRWGLDGEHRARWSLPALDANTWSFGLDRLLLGVAMADDHQRTFRGTLPLDDVAGGDVELAGRLSELVDRLATALAALQGRREVRDWREALASAVDALALAAPSEPWQRDQVVRLLDQVVEEASGFGAGATTSRAPLELSEVRSLLADRLRGRPTRANFRTGDLTACTLVPMRSVPHRVVCLLGLDDGVFPRHSERDGDDLLLSDPWVGDRDARSEDRQLLLDAVLAATEHLVITYSGRHERTNRQLPPAVPIAELLDVVDRTVSLDGGSRRARQKVVVDHPLQPFDPRNFMAKELGTGGPWSFDGQDLAGARALCGPRLEPAPFLAGRLPPAGGDVVSLDALVRFVEHPVRAFLRERIGLFASDSGDKVRDALPVELDGLERWEIGDSMLTSRLAGAETGDALAAERARGCLPPAPLADTVLDEITPAVEALVEAATGLACHEAEPESLEVDLRLPDGRLLVGTVANVRGATIVRCIYSILGPKHRLASWVRFLALTAMWPDLDVAAMTIGRGQKKTSAPPVSAAKLAPLAADARARRQAALDRLATMVDLYDRGLREPLPLYCATSAAWARARRSGNDPLGAARSKWESSFVQAGEDADAAHVVVVGDRVAFARVREQEPLADETGPGWPVEETRRFDRLARRLWDDLLDHESIEGH